MHSHSYVEEEQRRQGRHLAVPTAQLSGRRTTAGVVQSEVKEVSRILRLLLSSMNSALRPRGQCGGVPDAGMHTHDHGGGPKLTQRNDETVNDNPIGALPEPPLLTLPT